MTSVVNFVLDGGVTSARYSGIRRPSDGFKYDYNLHCKGSIRRNEMYITIALYLANVHRNSTT